MAVAIVVLVAIVIGLDRLSVRIVRPGPRPFERTVPETGIEYEDIRIPAGDHELAGWLLKPSEARDSEPLVIMAHGWGANYSTVLRLGEPLARAGHDVLLYDVQGHGRNGPVPFVTIRHFRDDLMAVARWARERFPGRPLALVGHSMGGAAGVLAVAEGAPIDSMILIAAPADVPLVTAEFLSDQGMPGPAIVNVMRPFWWLRIGSTFRPLSPERRIPELDLPLLMLQPEHDGRVLRHHADRLSKAGGLDYHLIRGREHTDVLDAPETLRLVRGFLSGEGSGGVA